MAAGTSLQVVSDDMDELPSGMGGAEWLLCPRSDAGLADVMAWPDMRHAGMRAPKQQYGEIVVDIVSRRGC